MRRKDLAISLLVAVLLHAMTGYCLGRLLGKWESNQVMPDFRKGLSSVDLNLVTISAPAEEPSPPEPQEVAAVPIEEQAPEIEQVETDVLDKGVKANITETTTDVRPRYPLGSRMRGEEGAVTIRVQIDAAGRAENPQIVETSGFRALDEAGLKAIRKASFRNANGALVHSTETTVTFRFKLID